MRKCSPECLNIKLCGLNKMGRIRVKADRFATCVLLDYKNVSIPYVICLGEMMHLWLKEEEEEKGEGERGGEGRRKR